MSKISEQKAFEAYPDVTLEECHGDTKIMNYCNNDNSSLREGYIEGYDKAMQDFLEKTKTWLFSDLYRYLVESKKISIDEISRQFKNYMQDEM